MYKVRGALWLWLVLVTAPAEGYGQGSVSGGNDWHTGGMWVGGGTLLLDLRLPNVFEVALLGDNSEGKGPVHIMVVYHVQLHALTTVWSLQLGWIFCKRQKYILDWIPRFSVCDQSWLSLTR